MEGVFVAPVAYNVNGANPRWRPFLQADLKELCKAAREFGRDSSYFKNVLTMTFSTNTMMPHDLKTLMTGLLNTGEYILWEGAWKWQLNELLTEYKKDAAKAKYILEHLCGEGNFTDPIEQAKMPELILIKISSPKSPACNPFQNHPSYQTVKYPAGPK